MRKKKKMISNQAHGLIRVPMTVWIYFCINFLFVRTAQVESQNRNEPAAKCVHVHLCQSQREANKIPHGFTCSDRLCIAHQRNTIETFLHNVVVVVFHFTNFFAFSIPLCHSGSSYYISFSPH